MRNDANLVAWKQWRATIPFTDAQIADALLADAQECRDKGKTWFAGRFEQWAARARRGYPSIRSVVYVLPRLVTACNICGMRALYRYGVFGRCQKHRDLVPEGFQSRLKRLDARGAAIEASNKDRDRAAKSRAQLKRYLRWQRRAGGKDRTV